MFSVSSRSFALVLWGSMQHLFWLVEGKIAGRSGPNKDPWDLAELKAAGIRAVLSVNEIGRAHV